MTHTNVIRIHDLGEISGIKYLTMPFVHGTDLARLLATEGKLPVERVVSMARQNGSARESSDRSCAAGGSLTRPLDEEGQGRIAAGRPAFADEHLGEDQASGKPVDQRADIYALGRVWSQSASSPIRRTVTRARASSRPPSIV